MDDFLIRINRSYLKVEQSRIVYLKADGKYIDLKTENNKYVVRTSLKQLVPKLCEDFIRIHSAYVINKGYLKSIDTVTKMVILEGDLEVPYSRTYKKNIFEAFIVS